MSDWSMYELDEITWDVFNDACDGVVPHHVVGQLHEFQPHCDSHKKAKHDLVEDPGNNGSTEENIFKDNEEAGDCSLLTEGKPQITEHSSALAFSKAIFPPSFTSAYTEKEAALGLDKTRTVRSSFCGQKVNENLNEFCSDDSVIEDTNAVDKESLGHVSVSISTADSDLDFFMNEPQIAGNGSILDYEWPDIGNFEDVDQMFSNGYSQFGQGSTGTGNELSWFSSSTYAIDGSDDGLRLGFQSSCSDLSSIRTPVEHNSTKMMNWAENGETTTSSYKSSNVPYGSYPWLQTNVQVEERISSKGMLDTCDATEGSKIAQAEIMNDNSRSSSEGSNSGRRMRVLSKSTLAKLNGKKKVQHSEFVGHDFYGITVPVGQSTERSTSQAHKFPVSVQPCSIMGTDSSSSQHSGDCRSEMTNTRFSQKGSTEFVKSDCKDNIENNVYSNTKVTSQSNHGHQAVEELTHPVSECSLTDRDHSEEKHSALELHGRVAVVNTSEQAASQTLFSSQMCQENLINREKLVGGDSNLEGPRRDSLQSKRNHSSIQANLGSLWSNNILSGSTSLRQLQDVLNQLDLRIKLCIRDGLFRLAKNAQQRHGVDDSSGYEVTTEGMGMDHSKRCPELMDVETGTNPIDRSIAHLLFYRASELSPSSATNEASSHESRVVVSEPNTTASTSSDELLEPLLPMSGEGEPTDRLVDR